MARVSPDVRIDDTAPQVADPISLSQVEPPTQRPPPIAQELIHERSIGWMYNFRWLVVRYERRVHIYAGLLHIACAHLAGGCGTPLHNFSSRTASDAGKLAASLLPLVPGTARMPAPHGGERKAVDQAELLEVPWDRIARTELRRVQHLVSRIEFGVSWTSSG